MMADLLPADAYKSPPVFQAERRGIFGSGWQVMAPAAALPDPGCYVAIGLGGWALFAMRGEDGAIRTFVNVCSHQKMPVLDNGRGQCDRLRCRYHGWTYDTLGRLVAAPPPVAPEDDEFEDYPLERLPCETVAGLVFARIATSAQGGTEPADMLKAAGVSGEDATLDGLMLAGTDLKSIEPNWKAVVDALLGGTAAPPVSDGGRFAWINPTTGLWREEDGVAMLQVVPRSFRKTELHVSMLAETDAAPQSLADRTSAWIDALVAAAAERQQAALDGAPPDPAVAEKLVKLHSWYKLATG